ncbi:Retinoic acid induced 16-like protein-domain-containing protein [Fimicolochytrium jonesii]|uniref:Retinoic acid induced 16-like protein-domain-containing protein n=1 Tax=Fimicolochytrium jonesii TaxID=1396493 RepID=UPI0022FDF315|nr:Retinoic acid induced 16-like protein-domain-containing protein [Fimicolochytrium jonesii]KAI8825146.1 Retinoic acid induced 16-like protein-domain-containing protein [Fimicolochytrium jonesii]
MDLMAKVKARLDKLAIAPNRSSGAVASNLMTKFQTCWDRIQMELTFESPVTRTVEDTHIPNALQQMLDILLKEQRLVEKGLISSNSCAELFLNTNVLGQLVDMSAADSPIGFRKHVIQTISSLIGLLEGQSLYHKSVNGAITVLINESLGQRNPKYEGEMLELESNIAIKVQELPALLNLFLNQHRPATKNLAADSEPRATIGGMVGVLNNDQKNFDFPLFDHLMRYVNSEGRHGDVARTSCSLLLKAGAENPDLEGYVRQTDFVIILVAGLGGLFSQLPPQLPFSAHTTSHSGRQGYASITFSRDVESFLNLMRFTQSVVLLWGLESEITQSILRGFADTFLGQAVGPQFMTASDFDGTAEAVLYYVRRMLSALEPTEPIAEVLVDFLLNDDDDAQTSRTDSRDADADQSSRNDVKLHVRDVLLSKLNSLSESVVTESLRLVALLVSAYPEKATPLLIDGLRPSNMPADAQRALTPEQLFEVVRQWMALLGVGEGFQEENSLDAYMEDAQAAVAAATATASKPSSGASSPSSHDSPPSKSHVTTPPQNPSKSKRHTHHTPQRYPSPTTLDRDATLQKLLTKLSTFFSQSTPTNLALTEILSRLAVRGDLAPYLFAADQIAHTPPSAVTDESQPPLSASTTTSSAAPHLRLSLQTILRRLHKEVAIAKTAMGPHQFETKLSEARENPSPLHHLPPLDHHHRRRRQRTESREGVVWVNGDMGGDDTEKAFWDDVFVRNVVVLEEFVKELVAVLLVSGGLGGTEVDFVA